MNLVYLSNRLLEHKVWLKAGSLIVVERPDDFRSMKKFVEVKEDDT